MNGQGGGLSRLIPLFRGNASIRRWLLSQAKFLSFFLPAAIPPLLWLRDWRKNRGRGFPVKVSGSIDPELNREPAKRAKSDAKVLH